MLTSKGIIKGLQLKVIKQFTKITDSNQFYLTGGTALSDFYLRHRESFDLDFFTGVEKIIRPFSIALEAKLRANFNTKVVRRLETFVEYEVEHCGESTIIQLAYDSPFKFAKPEETNLGILVNSYKDIIVDKALAFFGRTEPRDAVDLFFILKKEDFWTLVEQCAKKDEGFDKYWMAVALSKVKSMPDELSRWPVQMIEQLNLTNLKHLFLELSRQILERLKKDLPDSPI